MAADYAELLRESLDRHSIRPALNFAEESLTYGDLALRLGGIARVLAEAGLRQGEVMALYTSDKRAILLTDLAAMLMGAVSLPLNDRFTEPEMRYYLDDSQAALVVTDDNGWGRIEKIASEHPTVRGILSSEEVLSAKPEPLPEVEIGPTDPAFMLYSSGTTGQPKGVLHRHDNLACALTSLRDTWEFSEEDRLLNCLPLYHIHGLSFASHMMLLSGCEMVVQPSFHPRRTLDALTECTALFAIPTFYYSWLDHDFFREAGTWLSKVRLFTCGSAPIRPEVLPELEQILQKPITNRYGMTESHVITSLPVGYSSLEGSCGKVLPGLELRIVDEGGEDLPTGEVGEVWIRGPNLFREYWRKPEATAEAFEEGWFKTGDLGRGDEEGFMMHAGRCQELIITSGHNVYPPMVEKVINALEGVRESAVIGLPHRRKGEIVAAAVVAEDPSLSEAEVRAHCAERLVDYSVPARVFFVDELPRNTMSKVLKRELKGHLARGK